MGNEQFFTGWVKLRKYCEVSGETPSGVHAKRRAGHFIDGVHTKVADDGNLYVHIGAVQKWVSEGMKGACQQA